MLLNKDFVNELAGQFLPGVNFNLTPWRQIWQAVPGSVSTPGCCPSDAGAITTQNIAVSDGWIISTTLASGTLNISGCTASFKAKFDQIFGYTLTNIPMDVFRVHYPGSSASTITTATPFYFIPSGAILSNSGTITNQSWGRYAYSIPPTNSSTLKTIVEVYPYALCGVVNITDVGGNDFTAFTPNFGKLQLLPGGGYSTVDFAINKMDNTTAENYRLFDVLAFNASSGRSIEFIGYKIGYNFASTSVGAYTVIGG